MAAIILMLALMANSTYLQAFRSNELNGRNDNRRVRDSQFSVNRGPILIGSTPIAQDCKPTNDRFKYQRVYPAGPTYAPATGYYSFTYGRGGVEGARTACCPAPVRQAASTAASSTWSPARCHSRAAASC